MPLGLGSNVLVRDGGVRGTVVVLHAALNALRMRDGLDLCGKRASPVPRLRGLAAKHGRAEAEFLAGIPGLSAVRWR
jgi:UDP-N-acetylmuramate dehydrogenase